MVIACEANISCVISQPGKNLQRTLYERLVSSGLIRQRRRILAVIKVDRWPAQDSRHKVQVRQRVIQALEENTTPDTRNAACTLRRCCWRACRFMSLLPASATPIPRSR
jgi:hypothetical protein